MLLVLNSERRRVFFFLSYIGNAPKELTFHSIEGYTTPSKDSTYNMNTINRIY